MRLLTITLLLRAVAATPTPQAPGAPPGSLPVTTGGTGPHTSHYFQDPGLPKHTIYQPKSPAGLKVPVIVWGNGGCYSQGLAFQAFLGEVASFGYMLIAPGDTSSVINGTTTATQMKEAIDWVTSVAGTGSYAHVDSSRIGAWGQSCGGIEALANAQDTRIGHLGIFNSGQFSAAASNSITAKITKPIFYFIGGSSDIAYANAERDYKVLPAGTPSWKGNNGKGHISTFIEENAGAVGRGGVALAQWLLSGNSSASDWFIGDGAKRDGFTDVVYKNLDKVKVEPI